MNYFFRAKMSRFCVANLENSRLFSTTCALNRNILSPEKLKPDLSEVPKDAVPLWKEDSYDAVTRDRGERQVE